MAGNGGARFWWREEIGENEGIGVNGMWESRKSEEFGECEEYVECEIVEEGVECVISWWVYEKGEIVFFWGNLG